jgi:regulator of nucleoside diphosphate kinase
MSKHHNSEALPTIVVSKAEYDTLTGLAAAVEDRLPDAAGTLQAEMDRAKVVTADAVPADAVRMGSTVEFVPDGGQPRTVTLVFPGDADISEGKISILTPIGTALIGLSPGQSITWMARDGRQQRLTVLTVAQTAQTASA